MSKWEKVKLKHIASRKLEYGSGASAIPHDGKVRYIRITDIDDLGQLDNNPVSPSSIDDKYKLKDGDVLFARSGATVGKTFLYKTENGPCIYAGYLIRLVPNSEIANPKYIYYFTKSPIYKEFVESNKRVVAQPNINAQQYGELEVPLPPLETQKQIAKNLDTVSELLAMRKQQLAELDNLIKSIFYDMFGDPVTNEKGWNVIRLGDCLSVIGGYAFKSTDYSIDGIPVIKIGNINSGTFNDKDISFWNYDKKLDKYLLHPKDIVISLTGTVGKDDYANVCILPGTYNCYYLNQRNAKLELSKDINVYFLLYLLKDTKIKGQLTGISRGIRQANISNSDILSLNIPLPPDKLQTQFAEIVAKIEEQKALVKKAIDETQTLFDSLMSEYFD